MIDHKLARLEPPPASGDRMIFDSSRFLNHNHIQDIFIKLALPGLRLRTGIDVVLGRAAKVKPESTVPGDGAKSKCVQY